MDEDKREREKDGATNRRMIVQLEVEIRVDSMITELELRLQFKAWIEGLTEPEEDGLPGFEAARLILAVEVPQTEEI